MSSLTFDYHTLLFAAMAILIGFESINFAVFSRMFATSEGLLPEELWLSRLYRYVTLEVGLFVGAFLILVGAGMWMFGLSFWQSQHFGPLDPEKSLRIVIPAFVSLTLGVQIVLSSFFMSVLGMARRGLQCSAMNSSLSIYPVPASWLFERSLHFIGRFTRQDRRGFGA